MTEQQREIMIKAAVKFGGVWPDERATDILFNGEIFDWAIFDGHYSRPHFDHLVGFVISASDWLPFCNQKEFEAFMDGLAEKAPEGATHYRPESSSYIMKDNGWKKWDGSDWRVFFGGLSDKAISELIPLPKSKPAAWVPEVGQDYQVAKPIYNAGDLVKILFRDSSKNTLIGRYLSGNSIDSISEFSAFELAPLKAEAEIERERLYDEIFALDADLDDYQISRVIEFIQGRDNEQES